GCSPQRSCITRVTYAILRSFRALRNNREFPTSVKSPTSPGSLSIRAAGDPDPPVPSGPTPGTRGHPPSGGGGGGQTAGSPSSGDPSPAIGDPPPDCAEHPTG